MAKWTKQQARQAGKKGGATTAAKWAAIRAAKEREAMKAEEAAAFDVFERATAGIFDGFEMAAIFHEKIDKAGALIVAESDDAGDALGVHVGADGVACYFYTRPENVKKQVRFNRSVYLF